MKKTVLAAAIVLVAACAPKTSVLSPDGRIAVHFSLSASGIPSYSVDVDGQPLLEPSVMGLVSDDVNLDRGFALKSSRIRNHQETWHQPWGENKEVTDTHQELVLKLKNDAGVGLEVIFRVFDDGFGFRYAYAVPGADTLRINGERTQFAFASDAETWSIPGDFNSYEHLYRHIPLSELRDANTPLTLKFSDDLYAAVHEAALVDFPEMVLRHDVGLTYQASLAPLQQQRRRRGGLRRRRGQGPHLAKRWEPRGFSRVAAGFSCYDRGLQASSCLLLIPGWMRDPPFSPGCELC